MLGLVIIYIEYDNIIRNNDDCSSAERIYMHQCGWTGQVYDGITRNRFAFNDGNGVINYDATLNVVATQKAWAQGSGKTSVAEVFDQDFYDFGGLVCIQSKICFVFKQID